ncbi:MAG TPA: hypothetical protein VK611_07495 [Acidimicrobiales bacterium]|nr:hypothetical protein [Acidimicrobiales bacterium]
MSASTCQHCGHPATFSMTEHGYRGFVHEATGTTECPPVVRLTADLKARLHEAIDGEGWDRPGETTLADEAHAQVDAVPTGTVLTPGADEFGADDQEPLTPVAHVVETVEFFGLENVSGDWHAE